MLTWLILVDRYEFSVLLSMISDVSFIFVPRVGIDLPQIEVRFEHFKIEAEAHVGSRALPSFLNFCVGIVEVRTSVKELFLSHLVACLPSTSV